MPSWNRGFCTVRLFAPHLNVPIPVCLLFLYLIPVFQVVVEEAILPGEGRFLAYADGRLRVCFEDRTILHMNAARTLCKVLRALKISLSCLLPVFDTRPHIYGPPHICISSLTPCRLCSRTGRHWLLRRASLLASSAMSMLHWRLLPGPSSLPRNGCVSQNCKPE